MMMGLFCTQENTPCTSLPPAVLGSASYGRGGGGSGRGVVRVCVGVRACAWMICFPHALYWFSGLTFPVHTRLPVSTCAA